MDYRNNYNKNDYNPNEMDSYDANDPNQYNPQQRPPPSASQSQYPPNYQQRPSLRKNDYLAKNYNDFMERQGIPALAPEDLEILNECGRESLYYRCNYLNFLILIISILDLKFFSYQTILSGSFSILAIGYLDVDRNNRNSMLITSKLILNKINKLIMLQLMSNLY